MINSLNTISNELLKQYEFTGVTNGIVTSVYWYDENMKLQINKHRGEP